MTQNTKNKDLKDKKEPSADKKKNRFQKEQPIRHPLAKVVQDDDQLKINDQLYKILVNKNDAIDVETLRKKYDPYLDQYDFLVGDISSDHLRLKGFYKDIVRTAIDRKEQAIADYLTEYCNPGGAYFVLQLLSPEHHYTAHTRKGREHTRGRRRQYSRRKSNYNNNFKKRKVHKTRFKKKKTVAVKKEQGHHHSFVIKKRKGGN